MSKRTFGSAFRGGKPDALLDGGTDFVDFQAQAHANLTTRFRAARSQSPEPEVPGAWPSDEALAWGFMPEYAPSIHIFTTVGKFLENACTLPRRIINLLRRKHDILILPVLGIDGSSKKRLIDLGHPDEPQTPTNIARANAKVPRRPRTKPATSLWSDKWSPSSSPVPAPPVVESPITFASPLALAQACDEIQAFQASQAVATSISGIDASLGNRWDSILNEGAIYGITEEDVHESITASAELRSMVKGQFHSFSAVKERSCTEAEITEIHPTNTPISHSTVVFEHSSPPVLSDVGQAHPEAGEIPDSPHSTPETDVDADADATLPDGAVYDNDLSFLSDAPPIPSKNVTWASCATIKAFFCDAPVCDMIDSIVTDVQFSPVKRNIAVLAASEVATSEADAQLRPESPTKTNQSNEAEAQAENQTENVLENVAETAALNRSTHAVRFDPNVEEDFSSGSSDGGFSGVPADTWDDSDDSFDELHPSEELVQDFYDEVENKLDLAATPSPTPKPTPKPSPPTPSIPDLVCPLTDDEVERLRLVAKATKNGRKVDAVVVPGKQILARDFGTLLPNQFNGDRSAWLNDEIINEYLAILVKAKKDEAGFAHQPNGPAPPVHAFSSFFYNSLTKGVNAVARWAGRVQLKEAQYLDADLLLYPICHQNHWRLIAVKPKERSIEYFDSLGHDGSLYIDKFLAYLKNELGKLWIPSEWSVTEIQRSTRQINGSDCGVFTLLNALTLLRGEEPTRVISNNGMLDARQRIATTIMAGRPTTEFN